MTDDACGSEGLTRRETALAGLGVAAVALGAPALAGAAAEGPVIELRQYRIVTGKRDAFVALFDREFVETQEAEGMRLIGQFRDTQDANRFTWIREFPSMPARAAALTAFYGGPVWQAHRGTANPMLFDNDNVLLLRPARPGSGFGPNEPRENRSPTGLIVATILYLWKPPEEGFSDLFEDRVKPALARAGLPVLGSYIPEPTPNNFPGLPIRTEPRLFVWFTRAQDSAAYDAAQARLVGDPGRAAIKAALDDHLERAPQVLELAPTPRSALR